MAVAPTSARPGQGRHGLSWVLAILGSAVAVVAGVLIYHVVAGGSSHSATVGSSVAAAQTRPLPAFSRVELAGSNNLVVHVGGSRSVVVRADENLLDRVTTSVRAHTLVVGNRPGSFSTRSPMSVEISVPALDAIVLSGSGTITGRGRAARLGVTLSGSGTAQLTGLVAQDVRAVVSGSGTIFVTATARLDATVSGKGSILYRGNPAQVTKRVSGSGTIAAG